MSGIYTNQNIAAALQEAITRSKVKVEVWDKCNGFDVLKGHEYKVDGQRLQDRIESLISILRHAED